MVSLAVNKIFMTNIFHCQVEDKVQVSQWAPPSYQQEYWWQVARKSLSGRGGNLFEGP